MYTNDNQCECGHAKVQHHVDSTFTSKACILNQKACDCWGYQPRKQLSDHATDLVLSDLDIKTQGGY